MTTHLHPHVSNLIGRERRRDTLARADQRRLARQFGQRTWRRLRHRLGHRAVR